MIEKIFFYVIAFTIFIFVFIELIKKNDSNYVYLLVAEFLGITINFMELILGIKLNIGIKIITYVISILLPIIFYVIKVIGKVNFSELIDIFIADLYYVLNMNDRCKIKLNRLLKKYPNCVTAHKKLANIYEKEENIKDAIEEYEKVVQLEEENLKLYLKIGKLYKTIGKNQNAKQIYSDVLRENPKCYEASMALADTLYEEELYKKTIQVYMNALKYNPNDYTLNYNIGMTYTMLNDFQKAKQYYEKSAQINSCIYHSKYYLGQIGLVYGELDEATLCFQECINSEELEEKAYYYLARIAIIKGEKEKAINYANIAVEKNEKIYIKIQSDNMFVTIREKINKPKIERKKEFEDITAKELSVMNHLDETCKIVGKLNNNDIQMIENVMKSKKKDAKENIDEINNKYQQRDIN